MICQKQNHFLFDDSRSRVFVYAVSHIFLISLLLLRYNFYYKQQWEILLILCHFFIHNNIIITWMILLKGDFYKKTKRRRYAYKNVHTDNLLREWIRVPIRCWFDKTSTFSWICDFVSHHWFRAAKFHFPYEKS